MLLLVPAVSTMLRNRTTARLTTTTVAVKKTRDMDDHDKMGAEVVELQGGHPVYLQDPDAFVETLTKKLESLE
jgi:hypothetical protein